jgi:hypothetical protein
MKANLLLLPAAFSFLLMTGCGNSSSSNSSPADGHPNRIAWESIPAEFNPRLESTSFGIVGTEKIMLDLFGFDRDVDVTYSDSQDPSKATLNRFTVFKEVASFGGLNIRPQGRDISVRNEGMYDCSIQTHNGSITGLKGGCYVRIQLILPTGSQIEVYNVKNLITRRFIPIDTETFLKNVKDATWAKDKSVVIDQFVDSYQGTGKTPSLSAQQLGEVIHGFSWKDEKLSALRRIHGYVHDRENLEDMIKKEFSYFDQNEARQVVGIPRK